MTDRIQTGARAVRTASNDARQNSAAVSEWLTPADLARELDVHEGTLGNWRTVGKGPPFVRVVGAIRYRRAAVESWLLAREVRTTGEADAIERSERAVRRTRKP